LLLSPEADTHSVIPRRDKRPSRPAGLLVECQAAYLPTDSHASMY